MEEGMLEDLYWLLVEMRRLRDRPVVARMKPKRVTDTGVILYVSERDIDLNDRYCELVDKLIPELILELAEILGE